MNRTMDRLLAILPLSYIHAHRRRLTRLHWTLDNLRAVALSQHQPTVEDDPLGLRASIPVVRSSAFRPIHDVDRSVC